MRRLVFDIETAGRELTGFDESSRAWLEEIFSRENESEDGNGFDESRMAISPLTSEVITIAAVDADTGRGGVYFQAGEQVKSFDENGVKFETGDEASILKKFWDTAAFYDEFVTFAGRTFDAPVLMIRSAIRGITPSKNLMVNRYLSYQPQNAKHIDLKDQLSFYGAKYEKLGLHFWCLAFGIKSPKAGGVTGSGVTALSRAGEYEKIARYCLGDTVATLELFRKWEECLRF